MNPTNPPPDAPQLPPKLGCRHNHPSGLHAWYTKDGSANAQCQCCYAWWLAPAKPSPAATVAGEFLPDNHNWDEDLSHENGGYFCICRECRGQFMGHKRRQLCKECANLKESKEPPVADSLREEGSKDLYEAIQRLATMVGYSLQAGWHMEDWEIPLVVDMARMSIAAKCDALTAAKKDSQRLDHAIGVMNGYLKDLGFSGQGWTREKIDDAMREGDG